MVESLPDYTHLLNIELCSVWLVNVVYMYQDVQVLSCTKMVNDVALSHLCINKCQLGDPDVAKAIAVAVLYRYVIFVFFLLSVIVNI